MQRMVSAVEAKEQGHFAALRAQARKYKKTCIADAVPASAKSLVE